MKIIVGNLKMNLSKYEIDEYLDFFQNKNLENIFFAPSSIYLNQFVLRGLNTVSQDVSANDNGAYTGDVSASQLKSIGVGYSIVGHSERRKYYQDSKKVNQKIIRLLENNLHVILCIGEEKENRLNHQIFDVLKKEISEALDGINDKEKLRDIIIAYEPIWSIGTGLIPTNNEIEEVIAFIKEYFAKNYHVKMQVLYGGSVNNENIDVLKKIPNIDGYLVGGCSINKEKFQELITKVNNDD